MTHSHTLGPDTLAIDVAPFASTPLLDRLPAFRDAGFEATGVLPIDVWALEAQGMKAGEIRERIADHGLAVTVMDCIACWLPAQRAKPVDGGELGKLLRRLTPERVVDTAARIGARSVAAVEISNVVVEFDVAVEAFAALCDQAAAHGLKAHIEFVPMGGIPDLASAWRIVEAAGRPNGGLTIDSWHLFRSGSTLEQLARIPGDRIHAVQIGDAPAQAQADLWQELNTGRLLPGQGSFDLVGLIRTLDNMGSQAPIGVEVFSSEFADQPFGAVVRSLADSGRAIIHQARTSA